MKGEVCASPFCVFLYPTTVIDLRRCAVFWQRSTIYTDMPATVIDLHFYFHK